LPSRVVVEAPHELRRHPEAARLTWLAAFVYLRGRQLTVKSPTAYETLDRAVLQPRLLLCLHGIGTNAGLHSVQLRREIHEGLNVIEQWNGANDFVFFVRRAELTSNRLEDHEVSMLAWHLLQNCMIYINTLMLQQVLARPHWSQKLGARDLSALAPLI